MNLGPQKISNTYPYVINKSGSSFTLGDGGVINWSDAQVVTTSGTVAQTIGGVKTFSNNAIFNGNVGIGGSPSVPLDITSAGVRINTNRQISANADNGGLIVYGGTAGNGAHIELYGASHVGSPNMAYIDTENIYFRNAAGTSNKFIIYSNGTGFFNGDLGIGTSTPSVKLHVNGDFITRDTKISQWSSSNTDIDNLINGSTFGTLIEGAGNGHFTIGLRSNDVDDGFQIISKYTGLSSYINKCFEVKVDGEVILGTGSGVFIESNGIVNINNNGYAATRLGNANNNGWLITKESDDNSFNIWEGGILGTPVANRLKIEKGGRITANTDININGPNRKLILYSGGLNNNAYIEADSAGQVSIYNGTAGISNKFTVLSNGNVGIGIDSPQVPLEIANAGIRINTNRQISSNVDNSGLFLHGGTAGNGAHIELYGGSHVGSPNMAYFDADNMYFRSANATREYMHITNNGNVGIGTNSPTQKLDVHGSIKASGLQLTRGQLLRWGANNENIDDANITVINVGSDQTEMRFRIGDGNDLNDKFVFQQGNGAGGSSNTPMMTIQANGNVGIGTGNPAYKLDIISGGARILHPGGDSNLELGVGTTTNQYAYVDFVGDTTYSDYGLRVLRGNTGPNTFSNIYHRGTGLFQIGTQDGAPMMLITSGQERLTISGNGSTIVNGNLRVQGNLTVNGSMNISNRSEVRDTNLTLGTSYTNVLSISLTSGTWLVNSILSAFRSTATADQAYSRITDGSTTYASARAYRAAVATAYVNLSTTCIITTNATKTINLQAKGSAAIVAVASVDGDSGPGATQINAIKIA
jgi:hypothetical protein